MLGKIAAIRGKANNITAMRLAAAVAVIFSHAWPQTGNGLDPLSSLLGLGNFELGSIAVAIFFSASGYLLAASAERQSPVVFAVNRALRIYPALLLCLVVIMIYAAWVSGIATISDPQTVKFLVANSTMLGINDAATFAETAWIPGLFADTHIGFAIGSLWTLPAEIKAYGAVIVIMLLTVISPRRWRPAALRCAWPAMLAVSIAWFPLVPLVGEEPRFQSLFICFFAGATIYSVRNMLPLSLGIVAASIVALVAVHQFAPTIFRPAMLVFLPYATIYVAYGLPPVTAALDRFGDFSYGVYLYGWFGANIIVAADPSDSPMMAFVGGTMIAFSLAVVSWFLVEKPAMKLKLRSGVAVDVAGASADKAGLRRSGAEGGNVGPRAA